VSSAGVAAIVLALIATAVVLVWLVLTTTRRVMVVVSEAEQQLRRLEPVADELQRELAVMSTERERLLRDTDELRRRRHERSRRRWG
jgi:hypothetical protein